MTKAKKKDNMQELFEEYAKTKDQKLRDELIEKNLYIAEILAKKFVGKGIDYDDIFQIASLGLILAVDRYEPSRGFKFSSFATPTILGEIKRYFRDKGWTIKVPRRVQENTKKVKDAYHHLSMVNGEVPTVKEIADYLGIDSDEVLIAMDAGKVYTPQSIDYEIGTDDKKTALSDIIGDDDQNFKDFENREQLEALMKNLSKTEKEIVRKRFFEQKTQLEIAGELGLSQMSVSRIEKKALKEIKKHAKREDFY
ncbi:SigB/SigF/SigG family RNA polymerase sigma factor [Fenollaria sporofastidiosus]|uniref:SigB/SigF/SigG family RNA polymerase sigma factor n=1 Tax=Fenollaria sporofastidiosus TaxID=2811778 RepID=UPI001BFFFF56|nr:SigB/SigF/SigG family RNA polymerase sigma factor [Fenollaria sporofastidiosus]